MKFLRHLLKVNAIYVKNILTNVYFFPINLDNELVGETKLIFEEIFNELTSSFHRLVFGAVVRVKEEFMSNQVVGAVETQLLPDWGVSYFKVAIFRLNLRVDIWDVDIIILHIAILSK